MASLVSSPRSPYLQLEFTAEEDMAMASDAENNESHPARGSVERQRDNTNSSSSRMHDRPVDKRPRAMVVSTGAFFVALVLLMFITGFACRAFVFGILRILQEELDLTGGETITVVLSYDIGFLFVLLMMTCQKKIHRPKSIGFGGFLIGVGLLVICIPYFIVRSELTEGDWYVSKHELCDETVGPAAPAGNQSVRDPSDIQKDVPEAHWNSVAWIVIGLVLCGMGAVPQFPLGITYLDDKLRGFGTTFYIAFLLCAYLLGIWCGELTNLFMWQHVATANNTTVALWWLGFFCSALVALILGVFIFMAKDPYKRLVMETTGALPRVVDRTHHRYRRLDEGDDSRQKASKVQSRWRRILTNVQLLCIALGGSFEVAILTGFLLFLPRYVGSISNMGRGPSKFYIGTTVISSTCIGILTSSALTLYEKMKPDRLCRIVVTGCLVALLFFLPLYFFKCTDPDIAGNLISGETTASTHGNVASFLDDVNTTMPCNAACWCAKLPYRPVCGSDDRTYLSSCLAGCHGDKQSDTIDSQGLKLTNFTDCSCVSPSDNATYGRGNVGYALSGPCASNCSNDWPFLAVLFVAFFMTGTQFGPMILLSMRCVIRADRIAAVSFQVIVWHIVGYVPAMVYFSVTLNKSCVLWDRPEAHHYHECALYDSRKHNTTFVTSVFLLKVFALVLYVVAYTCIARKRGAPLNMDWVEYDTIQMEQVDTTNSRPSYL